MDSLTLKSMPPALIAWCEEQGFLEGVRKAFQRHSPLLSSMGFRKKEISTFGHVS
jgi:hypothetical protein